MKIHIYITIFLLHSSTITFAQVVPHLNFWSRFSLSQPIAEKWRAEAEFQHRRQNDFAQQTKNVFDENLLSSIRTWLHYQHKKDLNFSFSPFAYYWHSSIIVKEEDKQKPQDKRNTVFHSSRLETRSSKKIMVDRPNLF